MFGPGFAEHLGSLESRGLLRKADGRWHITTAVSYPAETINIRSTSPRNYLVVEETSGAILESLDESSALYQVHPGAIYLHRGEPYLVNRLDLETGTAYVRPNDGAYYTQARDVTDIRIRGMGQSKAVGPVEVYLGNVEVTNHVLSYRKRKPLTEEVLGEEYLDLPPRRFNTVALWFDMPERLLDRVREERLDLSGRTSCRRARRHRRVAPVRPVRPQRYRWRLYTSPSDTGRPRSLYMTATPEVLASPKEDIRL